MNFTQKRVQLALVSALVFYIISHPQMYALTKQIPMVGARMTKNDCGSCPTMTGMFVHAVVFFLITLYAIPMVSKALNK